MNAVPASRASRDLAYRLDGALIAPADFYRVACDPRRSVVVEACAGAGKTWMLVSRILRALLAGAEPQEILAITFTRKAAGEMRERLHGWLREFALSSDGEREQALRERGCTAAEARGLAPQLGTLYERLLAGGRPVEIRTFHGWFSQLLRAAPLASLERLGLAGEIDLLEERSELQPQYWRRFLSAVAEDPELREDFAALVRERGRHVAQEWLEAALDQRVEIERADAAGVLAASVPAAAALWPAFEGLATPAAALREPALVDLLGQLARELGASGKSLQLQAAAELEAGLAERNDEVAFEAVCGALHTAAGAPKKRLGERPLQSQACEALARIREAVDQQAAHATHVRLVRLARVLLASYRDLKRERGLADMADLETCAEALLGDAELSGWLQQRLDARVRHLLIDEFQDTSPLQWRTLDAWLAGYAGAGGGASGQQPLAVFIVGDPKQSIYRFRRADPRVFAQARDFVVEAFGAARLACDHTRRNAPAVLTALNTVFERAQSEGDFDGFRFHTTDVTQPDGAVALLAVVPRPEARPRDTAPLPWRDSLVTPRIEAEEALRLIESRQVATQIAALLERKDWLPGDIQVLCRKRAPLAFVAQALRELGIAHAAPEQRELMAAPEVRDLVALLDVLASPMHDLALAQVLRSPLFGAGDDELIVLALAARAAKSSWHAALLGEAMESIETCPALVRARALLPGWAHAAAALPPHDLLDRILSEGQVRACYAAALPPSRRAAGLAAIDALLAQSLLQDGGRYATPYNFVRALKRRRVLLPPQAERDAVQLLTIHGAKGLEARAVFVIDTAPEAPKAEHATLLIDWPADAAHPRCCAFVASESKLPASLRPLMLAEQAGRAREELNALYVAMTRAREQLVLSATAPHRAAPGISAWQRLADAGVAVLAAAPEPLAARAASAAPIVLRVLPRLRNGARAAVAAQLAGSASGRTPDSGAAGLGRAVHRVLEWLPAPALLAQSARAAAAEFGLPAAAADRIAALAGAVLSSPACRRFFEPAQLAWAGNEVPLAWHGELLRIDRLVALRADAGPVWWVLDYKLQHSPQDVAGYREQLSTYREAVRALRPQDAVEAAFITAAGALVPL
ncbi:MAG: UvrD-helicase domain-containing protein [Methylibium sp.]|uniref:UvrD-helicase domain-containing protein n=1 Tax=Methylibium sp. TaxID=2067992 RepID=UPI0017FA893C|nr:UvrD-helicase domain-containing protein [Methylibium sp.]MBA3599311.1 UvrD-helicase domain-containing protein [Methylibium sp.]